MKSICIITTSIEPKAGLGRLVTSTADALGKQGLQVGIISEEGDSPLLVKRIFFKDLSIFKPISTIQNLLRIRKTVRQYDAVVAIDLRPAGAITALCTIGSKTPIYLHTLGTYSLFSNTPGLHGIIKNTIFKWSYTRFKKIIILNDYVKRKIEESNNSFDFDESKIDFVSVGVDTNFFKPVSETFKDFNFPYILTVGAIKPRKGQQLSLEAFIKIADKYPHLHYVFVGNIHKNKYTDRFRETIDSHADIRKRIHLVENISDEDLLKIYSHAEFFVMTSTESKFGIEGFGMVYLEAALCGKTAVGAYDSGAEAAIINEVTGLLAAPDPEDISQKIDRILSDNSEREKLSEKAKEHAHTFTWEKVAKQYRDIIFN